MAGLVAEIRIIVCPIVVRAGFRSEEGIPRAALVNESGVVTEECVAIPGRASPACLITEERVGRTGAVLARRIAEKRVALAAGIQEACKRTHKRVALSVAIVISGVAPKEGDVLRAEICSPGPQTGKGAAIPNRRQQALTAQVVLRRGINDGCGERTSGSA